MNERLHKIISTNTVRISDNSDAFIGSGVVIKSLSYNKLYLFTAKHCFSNFNDESTLSFKIEFWDSETDTFSDYLFEIEKTKVVYDIDDLTVIEIMINDPRPNIETIKLATGLPPLLEHFTIAGFPDGSGNRFKTNDCTFDSVNHKTLFTKVHADLLQTNDTSANESTTNHSGSGIWFEHNNSIYLTAIMSEFCIGNPAFESFKLSNLLSSELKNEFDFYDLSLPKNDINENIRISQSLKKSDKDSLIFWSEYSEFIGRDAEILIFKNFIKNERKLLGITISGMGGVGKSRLLIEFNSCLEKKDWEVHYIDNSVDSIDVENLQTNAVIVVDGEKVKEEDIVRVVRSSYQISNNYKVRYIFVGRDVKVQLRELGNLCVEYTNFHDIELLGLSPIDYIALIQKVIAKRNESLQIDKRELQRIQNDLDKFRRPIFAILIGMALSDGKNITDWIIGDLLNYYYQTEIFKVRNAFKDHDDLGRHLNLIALLFIIGEPDYDFTKHLLEQGKSWLPNPDSINGTFIQNFLLYSNYRKRFIKLYPDILSSHFVLKRFEDLNDKPLQYGFDEVESILKIINDKSHESAKSEMMKPTDEPLFACVYRFKRLVIQDFPTHVLTPKVVKSNLLEHDNIEIKLYSKFILDLMFDINIEVESKVTAYESLIKDFTVESDYGSMNNLMTFYYYKIAKGFSVNESYETIKEKSDESERSPWEILPNFTDMNNLPMGGELLLDISKRLKMKENPEPYKVIWSAIPKIESDAIFFILSNNVKLADYSRDDLLYRLAYLQDRWSDLRIKKHFLRLILESREMETSTKLKIIDEVLVKALNSPKQIREIQVVNCLSNLYFNSFDFFIAAKDFNRIDKYYSALIHNFYQIEVERYNRDGLVVFINSSWRLHQSLIDISLSNAKFIKEHIDRFTLFFENKFFQ